eukprot:TRINITY_DN75327_c0_g1_i1.p1 TRINITY_DN75327_c0_g1~~TRINITY_DN75327_c0_g1_i1.p1  ORF type:complete len:880 (-),score=170.78 TRINITY_DN75327_c0_g1_i1:69-2708(-)
MSDDEKPPQGVIVAVRVRPLWTKGREKGCEKVVRMEGNTTILHPDPEDAEAEPKKYAFDYSYWSTDCFVTDEDGVHHPDGDDSPYASQEKVWGDIGDIILKNATKGYSCTVFAYGQSGAGKSYSVVGYSPNIGIIPRAVTEIFSIADGVDDTDTKFEVEIAMVEVYMGKVYDLLVPKKEKREELKVFINRGEVFIYNPKNRSNRDIIYRACKSAEQAEMFRMQGDKNRTVRPTGMNPSSSRAHTLFILRLKKMSKAHGEWTEQWRSKINLVDLAGSERPSDTGLSGIGLEEGVAINGSLSALGRVMVQLVQGKRVNYRADKLTEVLAESLNGRAVTCMIAALSPADINYGDTLSTLRFADNAKKMPVKVEKVLSPTQKLIADLQKENEALKQRLGANGGGTVENNEATQLADEAKAKAAELQEQVEQLQAAVSAAQAELESEEGENEEFQMKIKQLQDKIFEANEANQAAQEAEDAATEDLETLRERQAAVERLLEEQTEAFENKLQASEQLEAEIKTALADSGLTVREMLNVFDREGALKDSPYLVNMLADPGGKLVVVFQRAKLRVVRAETNAVAGLVLEGESIAAHHATFHKEDGSVSLEPVDDALTFVNGEVLHGARKLVHGDRIVFGMEHAFRFVEPGGKTVGLTQTANGPVLQDWDYCMSEVGRKQGKTKLIMQGVVANLAAEAKAKQLEKQIALLQQKLANNASTSSGGIDPGNGDGKTGVSNSAGGACTSGGVAEGPPNASHVMAQRLLGLKQGQDKVLDEVEDLRSQLTESRQFLEMLRDSKSAGLPNAVNDNSDEHFIIEKLVARLEHAERKLAEQRRESADANKDQFQNAKDERTEMAELLEDIKKELEDIKTESKKCCKCLCQCVVS